MFKFTSITVLSLALIAIANGRRVIRDEELENDNDSFDNEIDLDWSSEEESSESQNEPQNDDTSCVYNCEENPDDKFFCAKNNQGEEQRFMGDCRMDYYNRCELKGELRCVDVNSNYRRLFFDI